MTNNKRFGEDDLGSLIINEQKRLSAGNGFYEWGLMTSALEKVKQDVAYLFQIAFDTEDFDKAYDIAFNAIQFYAFNLRQEGDRLYIEENERRRAGAYESAWISKKEEEYIFQRWMKWGWEDGEANFKDYWMFLRLNDKEHPMNLPPPVKTKRRNKKNASETHEGFMATGIGDRQNRESSNRNRNTRTGNQNHHKRIIFLDRRRR